MAEIDKSKFIIEGCEKNDADAVVRPSITFWQDAWRRLKKNPIAMISLVVLIFFTIMVIIGPYISGQNYKIVNPKFKNIAPNSQYWFGTNLLGKDLFSLIWLGGRVSVVIGLVATFIQVVVGCIYGGIMAYFGGYVDEVMMRIIEVLNSVPSLLVTILFSCILGNGLFALLVALCITAWTGTARMIRGQIMQLRESEYVLAAKALGASPGRIITKHLIPNTIGLLILDIAQSIPGYIFAEAGLSFIGLGLQPPNTSWGVLISVGEQVVAFYPYQLIIPSIALCAFVLAFNLLGDGLTNALDPKLRQ